MQVACDTNCFIDATNSSAHAHGAMRRLLIVHEAGALQIAVSRHTLAELERKPDAALDLARKYPVLPHFPVGSWDDQVGTWDQVEGTWDDARRNQKIQRELEALAKAGTDIRDRGAYVDALRAGVDAFVTSDTQLVASAPAKRIEDRFGLRVLTPGKLCGELHV